jgi:hypothetical protein
MTSGSLRMLHVRFLPFRLAFGKLVGLVDCEFSELLDQPARPPDFERIDLADIRQAEMLFEWHTSEIGPTAYLAKLFTPASFHRNFGADRRPVALYARKPYVDEIARKRFWIIRFRQWCAAVKSPPEDRQFSV